MVETEEGTFLSITTSRAFIFLTLKSTCNLLLRFQLGMLLHLFIISLPIFSNTIHCRKPDIKATAVVIVEEILEVTDESTMIQTEPTTSYKSDPTTVAPSSQSYSPGLSFLTIATIVFVVIFILSVVFILLEFYRRRLIRKRNLSKISEKETISGKPLTG